MKKTPALFTLCLCSLFVLAACEKKKAETRIYFPDLKPPLGLAVKVLSDISLNEKAGSSITVIVSVPPTADRDELDRLMKSLWRQVKGRSGFSKGTADKIDLRFYGGETKAKAKGDDWLAQVLFSGAEKGEATFENRQTLPLLKWAKKAIGKQPQFTGKLKPQILADAAKLELEIKVPFIAQDGTGAYITKLTYTKVTTEFSTYTRTLFDKIDKLNKLTFIGLHEDQPVIKVWMSRQQYEQLNLRLVEEGLGAFQGKFINRLLSNPKLGKMVEKKVAKQRRKVYRETFARLPKEQVELAKAYR